MIRRHVIVSVFYLALCSIVLAFFAPVSLTRAAVPLNPQYYPEGAPTISGDKPTANDKEANVEDTRLALTVRFTNVILGLAGTIAIYFIVTNGWFLIASGGSEEVITQRKKGLTWAVIGLVLIVLSYSIIRFIIFLSFSADQGPQPAATSSAPASTAPAPSGGSGPAAGPHAGRLPPAD